MKKLSELKLAPGERVFLDRIEGDVATLLLEPEGEREENIPRDQLPEAAREGDRLRMTPEGRLVIDPEATTAGQAVVADLMAELLGDPAPDLGTPPPSSSAPSSHPKKEEPDR